MNDETPAAARRQHSLSGVRIVGTGSAVPSRLVTNADLERLMDTSDEWIVQRTGIRERHMCDEAKGESTASLATDATRRALESAGINATDLDLILCATMTPDMPTPSVASLVAHRIGAGQIGAMDICGACSGYVYAMNLAHAMLVAGPYRTIAVIGADCITKFCDFSTYGRAVSVLFGDAAGACILRAGTDRSVGMITHAMRSDGGGSRHLFIPMRLDHFPDQSEAEERKLGCIQMHGAAVFKFAVNTFPDLIAETLDQAGLKAGDIDHFICHQSNARILAAARDRFGIPEEKLFVNIDRFGNTVAASIPLILDQLTRARRVRPGQRIMLLAFGAGLTWGSSLWQI